MDIDNRLEVLNKEKKGIMLEEINLVILRMRNNGFTPKEMSIEGKRIDDMTDDELIKIGPEELHKLGVKLLEKARKEKERMMSDEQKKLEYLERAKRETIIPILKKQWDENTEQEIQLQRELHLKNYEDDISKKRQMERLKVLKKDYIDTEEKRARIVYETQVADWQERMKIYYKNSAVEEARKRIEDEKKKKEEDEKRRKEDEERAKKAETNKKDGFRNFTEDMKNIQKESFRKPNEPLGGWRNEEKKTEEIKTGERPQKKFFSSKKVEGTQNEGEKPKASEPIKRSQEPPRSENISK